MEWLALLLFVSVIVLLLAGFPVAFSLGGTALILKSLNLLLRKGLIRFFLLHNFSS